MLTVINNKNDMKELNKCNRYLYDFILESRFETFDNKEISIIICSVARMSNLIDEEDQCYNMINVTRYKDNTILSIIFQKDDGTIVENLSLVLQ